ncbi:hypothetical protein ACSVH5_02340 [Flavobacterium sp. RSSA_27]|uniref:hypothetical protein n=1 Tax=Flavobacterium sp. RSSA_27 TaxID=3447667 RepID=UPI003F34CF3E
MQTKFIKWVNNTQELCSKAESTHVYAHEIHEKTVQVSQFCTGKTTPILLEIQHEHLVTLLDLTGVVPYEIWYFDQNKQFTGKAFSTHTGSGSFRVETQARFVFLVHLEKKSRSCQSKFNYFEWEKDDVFGSKNFPPYFGKFPYLIIKQRMPSFYTQLPLLLLKEGVDKPENYPGAVIHINEEIEANEDKKIKALLHATQQIFEKTKKESPKRMCLVINEDLCYYFEPDKEESSVNESIPSGGNLLSPDGKLIAMNVAHFMAN